MARVSDITRCFGLPASALMNGRLISVERARQLDLRLLGGLLQALQGHPVLGEVDPLVALELLDQPVDDALVEVVAAEVGVTVRGRTSNTPSPSSRIEMSNVPPPRS